MLFAPDTPFAKLCHRELVERPVALLARFRSHHILYAAILLPVMFAGGEFIAILGPEFFAAYAMELAIYVDAVIAGLALSVWSQVKSFGERFRTLLAVLFRRSRRRAKRLGGRKLKAPRPANDDEDRPAVPSAA